MRRILSIIVLMAFCAFSVSGCGGSDTPVSQGDSDVWSQMGGGTGVFDEAGSGEQGLEDFLNGDGGSAAEPAAPASEAFSEEAEAFTETAPSEEAETPSEGEYQEYETLRIDGFSEGRAWVEYQIGIDEEKSRIITEFGLIDENRKILCTAGAPGTPVKGGYTMSCGDEELIIFNKDGNESYRFTNTPEDSYYAMAAAEDFFLVMEHVTGFTGNEYFLFKMDHEGKPISDKINVTESNFISSSGYDVLNTEVRYLGENIYHICDREPTYIYNSDTNQYFEVKDSQYIAPFYEGKSLVIASSINRGPSPITAADLKDEAAFTSWAENKTYLEAQNHDGEKVCGEGIFYDNWTNTFYNYDLEPVFGLPDYGDNVQINDPTVFSGGYAAIPMVGADTYPYVVFIDKTGTPQSDPICLGKQGDYMSLWDAFAYKGKFFFKLGTVGEEWGTGCISVDGSLKKYYVDRDGWFPNAIDDDYIYYNIRSNGFDNGGWAVGLESGDVIHTVKKYE